MMRFVQTLRPFLGIRFEVGRLTSRYIEEIKRRERSKLASISYREIVLIESERLQAQMKKFGDLFQEKLLYKMTCIRLEVRSKQ
jgi:hypothetical protein